MKNLFKYHRISGLYKHIVILLILFSSIGHAQDNRPATGQKIGMIEYLEQAEKNLEVQFYYRSEWLDTIFVKPEQSIDQIEEVKRSLSTFGLELIPYSDWQYVLTWQILCRRKISLRLQVHATGPCTCNG